MKKVRRDHDIVIIVRRKNYTPARFFNVAELILNEHATVRENGKTLMSGPVWKILLMLDPEVIEMRKHKKERKNNTKKELNSFANAIWPIFDEVERGQSPLTKFEKIVEGRK